LVGGMGARVMVAKAASTRGSGGGGTSLIPVKKGGAARVTKREAKVPVAEAKAKAAVKEVTGKAPAAKAKVVAKGMAPAGKKGEAPAVKRGREPAGKKGKTMGKGTGEHRIFGISVASVYPLYVAKVERKGRRPEEVEEVVLWLTGHTQASLGRELAKGTDFKTFFAEAPAMHPNREHVTGVVCGVRIEDIGEPTMREIRRLDKLVDELAKGRPMAKILR